MNYKFSKYNIIIENNQDNVLVYNSFTGSFCEMEKSVYEQISDNNEVTNTIKYFDALKEEGIIVPLFLDEYQRVVSIEKERMYKQNPESVYTVIALTLACNMQCEYCFEAKQNSTHIIDHAVVKDLIIYLKKQIEYNTHLKTFAVSWFGGEPLLGYNEILEICDEIKPFCEERGVTFLSSMITNGLLLTDERVKTMVERCNLYRVQVTLDGMQDTYCNIKKATPFAYNTVLNNIVTAANRLEVVVRLNASKSNFEELKKVAAMLFEGLHLKNKIKLYIAEIKDYTNCFKADCHVFNYGEFELAKNEFYQYLENEYHIEVGNLIFDRQFKDTTCGLIRVANMVIGPQGELYKCEHGLGNPNDVVGTIQDGCFYNDAYNKFCGIYHFDKCKSCSIFPICLSGCRSQQISFGEKSVDCDGITNSLILSLKKYYKKEVSHEGTDQR